MLHHAYEVKAMFVSQLVDDSSKEWDLIREIANYFPERFLSLMEEIFPMM